MNRNSRSAKSDERKSPAKRSHETVAVGANRSRGSRGMLSDCRFAGLAGARSSCGASTGRTVHDGSAYSAITENQRAASLQRREAGRSVLPQRFQTLNEEDHGFLRVIERPLLAKSRHCWSKLRLRARLAKREGESDDTSYVGRIRLVRLRAGMPPGATSSSWRRRSSSGIRRQERRCRSELEAVDC